MRKSINVMLKFNCILHQCDIYCTVWNSNTNTAHSIMQQVNSMFLQNKSEKIHELN